MIFFRRKKKSIGIGEREVVFLRKELEVLNYVPVDYMYTEKYAHFLRNNERILKKRINSTSPDDLCDNMLDSYIDAIVGEMKASAKEQYTHHMHFISHYKGIVDGKLTQGYHHLENLQQDLTCIEEQIQTLKNLQKTT